MTEYRRNFVKGGSYFFTVALADRSQNLLVDHIDVLRKAFRHVKAEYPFVLDAMAVLPEHLHCIWTLPAGNANYPDRWRRIKAAFSRSLPHCSPRSLSKIRRVSAAFGSAVIGSIHYEMMTIGNVMWITFITTRSNISMWSTLRIGRIPHFIVMWRLGYIKEIGLEVVR